MFNLLDMLPTGILPRVGIAAAIAVTCFSAGVWLGIRVADDEVADCRQDFAEYREDVSRQTSEALSALATRFADAESRYEAERDRRSRTRERVVTEIRHEIRELPVRDCSLTPAAHRLLTRAHCAAGGDPDADPECLSESVRGAGDTSTSGQ